MLPVRRPVTHDPSVFTILRETACSPTAGLRVVGEELLCRQLKYAVGKKIFADSFTGNFYELYELDAEIGHKELDWKMTVSGVGKCRQVGISENGIDDAVDKLVARGYKVGRVEQMESANDAKARGSNSANETRFY